MSTVLPISARKAGELARLLEEREYGNSDFQLLNENPDDVVALIDAIKARKSRFLKLVREVKLPAILAFKPEDHFKVTPMRERKTANVVIGYVSNSVKALIKGRLEPEEAETTIRIHELCQASVDDSILAELGENVKTGFNRMFQMMEKQGRGQEGDLLVDGRANLFYIEGTDWAVRCCWSASYGRWSVITDSIRSPFSWYAGYQVVSR